MKDKFSTVAGNYANYRPGYPIEVYHYILSFCQERNIAWDCGTGNGQVAKVLAQYFQQVYATDISQHQIDHAFPNQRIKYKVESAEDCSFNDNSFDLIASAQAIHWFNLDKFYSQVLRTLKPNGVIVILGYGLIQIDKETDTLISTLYNQTLKDYWDPERKYIDDEYKSLPFPFSENSCPSFKIQLNWTLQKFLGYLDTWSALTNYRAIEKTDPLPSFNATLRRAWKDDEIKQVEFPVFMRMGKIK